MRDRSPFIVHPPVPSITDTRLDLAAWLRLTLSPELSNTSVLALLHAFGQPEQVFTAPRAQICAAVGDKIANALAKEAKANDIDAAARWIGEPNHHFVGIGEKTYPAALMQMPDPPAALYVQGRVELLSRPAFAIVGSRNATAQGARDAQSFAHTLSNAGLAIVSGLALGIDAAAHRGGLRAKGSSIAVMGTGADRIYPPRNRDLAHELASNGALVSEFPLATPPLPGNFPRRNRLISGLSRGVLVVEAALMSGSLITARFALEQNRDVFAIPGSIHSPLAKGSHRLIKDGAKLVECAEDIPDELGLEHDPPTEPPAGPEDDDTTLDAMGQAPVSVDELAERTGDEAGDIAARLSLLEIEGRIASVAGGLFQRLRGR